LLKVESDRVEAMVTRVVKKKFLKVLVQRAETSERCTNTSVPTTDSTWVRAIHHE